MTILVIAVVNFILAVEIIVFVARWASRSVDRDLERDFDDRDRQYDNHRSSMNTNKYGLSKMTPSGKVLIEFSVVNDDGGMELRGTPITVHNEQHLEMLEQLIEDANAGVQARMEFNDY